MNIPTYIRKVPLLFMLVFSSLLVASALHASDAPEVTSGGELAVPFGESFTYDLEATNEPLGYSVLNLPYWIQRKENKLEGKAVKIGTHSLEIYAMNASGVSAPHILKITVVEPVTGK
jgi:hypothetical protein